GLETGEEGVIDEALGKVGGRGQFGAVGRLLPKESVQAIRLEQIALADQGDELVGGQGLRHLSTFRVRANILDLRRPGVRTAAASRGERARRFRPGAGPAGTSTEGGQPSSRRRPVSGWGTGTSACNPRTPPGPRRRVPSTEPP